LDAATKAAASTFQFCIRFDALSHTLDLTARYGLQWIENPIFGGMHGMGQHES